MEKLIVLTETELAEKIDYILSVFLEKFSTKEEPTKLTRSEVCERLHITLPTLHSYIKRGLITAKKIGGRTLFDASDIENAVQENKVFRYKHGRGA